MATDRCVAVCKIRYQYDTADTPDHTIQASGENAPQVVWNPKGDYAGSKSLSAPITSAANIPESQVIAVIVKQSGWYIAIANCDCVAASGASVAPVLYIKAGSATYGAAINRATFYDSTYGADQWCNVCGFTKPIYVKKSLESDYPGPEAPALRPIHGCATAISK